MNTTPRVDDAGAYLPTEDELIAARDAIRRKWTPAERWRRSHGFDPANEPSAVEVPEVAGVVYSGSRAYLIG